MSFPSVFASESLTVLGLTFRLLIHFEFVFVCGARVQLHCFACGYPVFPALFVEKSVLSPLKGFNTFQNSFDYICESLFLGSLFSAVGLYVCLYAYTTLFRICILLLW